MRTSAELREGFLSFFEERGHLRFPSFSLIPPSEDLSTLFVVAGMQPLKPYFSGQKKPPAPRFTTVQKCLRAGGKDSDLEKVGLNARSASMFEMLGNFSFGDYFKEGAVDLAWEFVTEHLKLDPDRIWTTVFAGDPQRGVPLDDVAVQAWLRKGIPRDRIVPFVLPENWWGPAGDTGPCGPCSELHYDRGEEHGCGRDDCGPNCEHCDRFIEFWNLVFMEFDLGADGTVTPLPQQNIDTGLGLERTAMVLQGVDSIFDTDGFRLIMDWIERESGIAYGSSPEANKAHRVITDHLRGTTFLIAEGITPSNEARGYVLRRLIRRAVVQARRIGLERVYRVPAIVIEQVGRWYPETGEHAETIERVVRAEEERFRETLERGMRVFDELAGEPAITGEQAFTLAATHGFPVELTVELAQERGQAVDLDGYGEEMARHREISRAGGETRVQRAAEFARAAGFETEFVGWERTEALTQLGAVEPLGDGLFFAKLRESPFYAEGGGQVSDQGFLEHEQTGARTTLHEAYRVGDDQVLVFDGDGFAAGDRVRAVVSWTARFPTMANHTATHLLHKALREVLGEHVRQAGSAVRPDKLRFDFTHPQALTEEERDEVERRVNEQIFRNASVRAFWTTLDEAQRLGATMLFGEKYGDRVRVVEVDGYSRELCGGTHVRSTAEIGPFVLVSESSVGAGARRIEAITAGEAWAFLHARAGELDQLRGELERVRREARTAKPAAREAAAIRDARESEVGGVRVLVAEVDAADPEEVLRVSDREKQRRSPAAVVLGARDDGKVHLVANFDPDVAARVSASDVVRGAAAIVGGGGGGRPTMARAGGRDPERLPEALAEAERLIRAGLA